MGTFKFLLIPEERTSGNRVSFQSISFKFALLINEGTRDGIHEIDSNYSCPIQRTYIQT